MHRGPRGEGPAHPLRHRRGRRRAPRRRWTTSAGTGTRARCGSGTVPRPSSSSTSWARSWTRSTCTTGTAGRSPTSCGRRCAASSTGWRRTGRSPTAGSGRSAGPTQRFTYSTLMTWVAFERAGRLARRRGLPAPLACLARGGRPGLPAAPGTRLEPADRRLRAVPGLHDAGRRSPDDPAGGVHRRGGSPLPVDPGTHRGGAGDRQPGAPVPRRRQRRLRRTRGHLQPLLVLVRGGAHPGRTSGAGPAHLREDADLRQPPRAVLRGDRPVRRGAGQLPAGVHAPRAHPRGGQAGPGPGARAGR